MHISLQIYFNLSLLISFTILLCITQSTRGSLSMYICMCTYIQHIRIHIQLYTLSNMFKHEWVQNEKRKRKNNKEQWKPKSIKHSTAGVRSKDHHEERKKRGGGEKIFAHVFTKKSDRRVGMILDHKFNGHLGSKFVPLCDRNGFFISRVLLIGWIYSTLEFVWYLFSDNNL